MRIGGALVALPALVAVLGTVLYLWLSTDETAVLHVEMTLGIAGVSQAQVFWSDSEALFSARRQRLFEVRPGRATYEIPVPADPGRLRIDPASEIPATIDIHSIRLTRWGLPLRTWDGRQGFGDWSPFIDLTDFGPAGGALHMRTSGPDPALATEHLRDLGRRRRWIDGAISLLAALGVATLLVEVRAIARHGVAESQRRLVRGGRWLLKSAAILALGACLAEIAMRAYHHFVPVFVFPSDGTDRFRGRPFALADVGGFHLNSHGFMDVEFETSKPPDTIRILGLGDSFAFGVVPYEANYLTLLEKGLAGASPPAEVINMGIPSTGPRGYLEVLASEGLPLHADMVLLSFFMGNDFVDEDPPPPPSYLLAFARYVLAPKPKGILIGGVNPYRDDEPTLEPARYMLMERDRAAVFRKSNPLLEEALPTVRDRILQIKRLCDARGLDLLVVLIPDEMQVDAELQAQVVASLGGPADDFDFYRANLRLAAELQDLGIRHLDLLGPFQWSGHDLRLYKPRDSHWNIAGNRLAADLIRDEMLGGRTKFWPRPGGRTAAASRSSP